MEVIGIFDGGKGKIKHKGQSIDVNVIIFRTQERESAPVDHIGYYSVFLKKSVINALKNIHWYQPAAQPQAENNQETAADA
jgi:hypothetical protein